MKEIIILKHKRRAILDKLATNKNKQDKLKVSANLLRIELSGIIMQINIYNKNI